MLGRKVSSFDLEKFCPPCHWILLGIGILWIGFILFAIISITIKGIIRIISDKEQVRTIVGILSSLALFYLIIFVLPKCLRSEVNQLPKSGTAESSQNNLIKNIGKEYSHYWMHDDPENDIRIILEFFQDYFKMEHFSYSESNELRGPIRVD